MTSNIGAEKLTEKAAPMGFYVKSAELKEAEKDYEAMKEDTLNSLKEKFRPEFLNRIDKVVVFHALTHEEIKKIVQLHVGYLQNRLAHRKITISLTDAGLKFLAEKSYDPAFGARPVRRAVQEYIEDPLTQKLIDGEIHEGDNVQVVGKGSGKDTGVELIRGLPEEGLTATGSIAASGAKRKAEGLEKKGVTKTKTSIPKAKTVKKA